MSVAQLTQKAIPSVATHAKAAAVEESGYSVGEKTKEIILLHGEIALVDAEDYDYLSKWGWHRSTKGYAVRSEVVNGKKTTIMMHRVITGAPAGTPVDHANRITLDNRRKNLRLCDTTHNHANRGKTRGRSQFKGVIWDQQKEKWRAGLIKYRRQIYGGHYSEEAEAARAYDRLATEHYGEFACVNFPKEVAQ